MVFAGRWFCVGAPPGVSRAQGRQQGE